MNKENLEEHMKQIGDIFANTKKIKGDNFADMVRFVGTIQSFGTMMLGEAQRLGASEEEMDSLSTRAALFSSALCAEYGRAVNVPEEDLSEVFKIVELIEDKIQAGLKD